MEFFRLFTAIRPPPEIIDELMAIQSSLARTIDPRSLRWVRRSNLHLTMHFLGDTAANRVDEVRDAMDVCAGEGTGRLALSGVGAFPNAMKPRVVWAGLRDLAGALQPIYRTLGEELRNRDFKLESRAFRPHITLGYVRKRPPAAALREITAAISAQNTASCEAAEFAATRLVLVRSTLAPGGSVYEDLYSVSLSDASDTTSAGESARE